MEIINLTGEDVSLIHPETNHVGTLKRSTLVATAKKGVIHLNNIKVGDGFILESENYYVEAKGLPSPENGILYLVRPEVFKAEPLRKDLRVVNEPVLGQNNKIIGYKSITRYP